MRRRLISAVFAVVATAALAVPAAAAEDLDAPRVDHYVALGDSFASGPFIPVQRTDPIGCARSTRNYPSLLAEQLNPGAFTDVSCGGAKTVDMTAPQQVLFGSNAPQFEALTADTDLVTVTIGGNDIGFADIIADCGLASITDPRGNPCERKATAGGTDSYRARIAETAPKVDAVLGGIHERSPDATVVLVGYLRILPPTGGCFPIVPIARGDVPYLDGVQQDLNAMMAKRAAEHGAVFVDTYAESMGRDACQLPWHKWVEGLLPTRPAFPVHPNASGMKAVAGMIVEALR